MMPRLTDNIEAEVLSITACRLIGWGASERQAHVLAKIMRLERQASDAVVEAAVIEGLVSIKQAVDGVPDIEYPGGQRRDTLRLEGR
jgi:hypothetical protein